MRAGGSDMRSASSTNGEAVCKRGGRPRPTRPSGPGIAAPRPMTHRNLDFEIPLTREQWEQLGESADMRPDYGVLRWAPAEFDVIRVSMREDELPRGWLPAVPRADAIVADREVA